MTHVLLLLSSIFFLSQSSDPSVPVAVTMMSTNCSNRRPRQCYHYYMTMYAVAASAFVFRTASSFSLIPKQSVKTTTPLLLNMVYNRGLETRVESATPQEGGMSLYLKAGPDGTSVGDCPFAHYVRMVLSEKGLDYELKPSTQETKPNWLVEVYDGKMPALRHSKECYTESDVICQYLDYFFQEPPLTFGKKATQTANDAVEGFFPAVAKYFKHTPDGDEEDLELKDNLEESLQKLETHLTENDRTGPYLVGNGERISLLDCSLAPKLYHLQVGLDAFKSNAIDLPQKFPAVQAYMDVVFERPSFMESIYPKETVVWGWSNARE